MGSSCDRQVSIADVYRQLHRTLGRQLWWPADSPFEVAVGAILTQRARWTRVAEVIENLQKNSLLACRALAAVSQNDLQKIIRPAGTYRRKSRSLKALSYYIINHHNADASFEWDQDDSTLRRDLLSIEGIGPETADSILLYAARRPFFVIDAY